MNNQISIEKGWLIMIFLITTTSLFFIPPIIPVSNIELRIDDIVILSIMPLTLLVLYKEIELSIYVKILITVFISMVISTLYGYVILGVPFSLRDINELIRMIKPLFLFSFLLLLDKELIINMLFKFLIVAMIIFIFIGLCESLKIPYFYEYFVQLYSSSTQDNIGRINISTLNPNDGAVLTLFFLFFSTSMLVVYKKYYYLLTTLSLTFILLNAGSRTAFLIAIIFFIFFIILAKSFTLKHKLIGLFIFFIVVILLYPYIEHYITRIISLFNALELRDTSLNIRFKLWNEALNVFYHSKVFGWGVAKSIHQTTVDGEYFLLLRRYGVLGCSLVLFAMIYPLFVIQTKFKLQELELKEKVLFYTLFLYIVSGLFVMFTNNFFTSYILVFPFILLCAPLFKNNKGI